MKAKLFALLAIVSIAVSSCYDDSALIGRIEDHEQRIQNLETLCSQMNTNISSLQDLLQAMQDQDYITSVTPVNEGDKVIGYVINFAKAAPVTIYHGEDGKAGADGADGQDGAAGKDGHTPVIGVKKYVDQVYYWTIDGEWLLDEKGNKVRAVGQDGKDGKDGKDGEDGISGSSGSSSGRDGITPKLKIEADYWWVSYDNGISWQQLGKAVSEGSSSNNVYSDSIFESVTIENDAVKIVLLDGGEVFYIPRHQKIDILLDIEGDQATVTPGETLYISYQLENVTAQTLVTAGSDGNYKVRVRSTDQSSGVIEVDCPSPYVDGFVNVTVSDGNGYSYVKCISFCERQMSLYNGYEYNVNAQGGEVNIPFDINFDYTVSTNESWISVVETKSQMREGAITLSVEPNAEMSSRQGVLNIYADGNVSAPFCQIHINQASAVFSIGKSSFVVESEGGDVSTSVVSSNGLSVNAEELPGWISVTTENYGDPSYEVTLTVSQNTDGQLRSAEISLYDESMTQVLGTVKVVQRPYLSDDASAMIFRVRANFANNFTCSVPITDYYYDYYYHYPDCFIDWGDGTVDHVTSENYETARTHTYEGLTQGQDFEVKVTGYVPALSGGGADSGITHVLQWGNTGLRSMNSAFDGNNRLESIPTDNTGAFAEVTYFGSCFYGCSSLTDLPEGLFVNCPNVTSFESCFNDCDGLTELPEGLFANCPNVTSFESCFHDCDGLTELPEDLFANCSNVTYFGYCFQGCSSLTELPEGLFANCPNVTSFESCFHDCDGLTELPEDLFANCSNVTYFGYCFQGCSSLTDLPEGLFANCPKVADFGCCFQGCSSLTDLPEDLFANCSNVTYFGYCFQGCSSLTDLPEGLFANCSNVTDFRYCFSGCSSLTEVPVSLFDNNRMVLNFSWTFYGCYFSGESPYTEIDGVKYHLYERCNAPDHFKTPTSYYKCFDSNYFTDWDSIPSDWK